MNNYSPYFNLGELIAKFLQDKLSEQEKIELENWLQSHPANKELFKKLTDKAALKNEVAQFSSEDSELAWQNIVQRTGYQAPQKKIRLRSLIPYAAAIIALFGGSALILRNIHKKEESKPLAIHPKDLLPGGNKATLTLANGSKITLDDSKQGNIAKEHNVIIAKRSNGEIVYNTLNAQASQQPQLQNEQLQEFNIISTPRGGQYAVVLSDGTKVWLNSASTLKYPANFTGAERRVELSGEAYFEVAKDATHPFLVHSQTQTVEVLGTHFNINSYQDEKATKTTLLEGSVRITGSQARSAKLQPGQQAVNGITQLQVIINADVYEAVAWKNGKFLFHDTDLQTIMRQLSRWYDVDIEYQGTVYERHYSGRISRAVPVSQLFEILKTSGLNFTINGRKIIVKS